MTHRQWRPHRPEVESYNNEILSMQHAVTCHNGKLGRRILLCCFHPSQHFYAALLPRKGPHIASHSVCPSVCPSVPFSLPSVTSRHLANYNDTHVLFGTRCGPHIVRPSGPHKFLLCLQCVSRTSLFRCSSSSVNKMLNRSICHA